MIQMPRRSHFNQLITKVAPSVLLVGCLILPMADKVNAAEVQLLDIELAEPQVADPSISEPQIAKPEVAEPKDDASEKPLSQDEKNAAILDAALALALNNALFPPINREEESLLPQNYKASGLAARIAQVAQQKNLQGAAYNRRHLCQQLLRETVQQVTQSYNRFFQGSALKTMRAFQSAGVGRPYQSGMQLLPGDMLYTGRWGGDYGHAMVVGPDGRIRDNVGSGVAHPRQRPIDWIVRPGDGLTRLVSNR